MLSTVDQCHGATIARPRALVLALACFLAGSPKAAAFAPRLGSSPAAAAPSALGRRVLGGQVRTPAAAAALSLQHPARRRGAQQRSNVVLAAGRMPLPCGSLVALATPMMPDGSLDVGTLRAVLQWHKAEGTDGIVILGTTGEASTLTYEEKEEVMTVTREELGGSIPIVVGTGTISTEATISATKQAQRLGADAALVVTPYYVKPSQAGLAAHFTAVADACEVPLVLYNVPGRTGVDLSVETTVTLARHPKIVGLKDATGDNTRVGPMRTLCGDDFKLYSGEDAMARDYVLQGGDGVISVTANVAPGAVAKVMAMAKAGDGAGADKLDSTLAGLHRDLFCEANPIPVKWALARMGKTASGIRLPLVELNANFHSRLEAALQAGGCIEGVAGASGGTSAGPDDSWPAQEILLQGHLFDSGLINQVLELIENRGGDFLILNFSAQPNDQRTEFNMRRKSSVNLKIFGADKEALADLIKRVKMLVSVMESADGELTEVKN
eukprot:CAMPEP_0172595224 /NCGR_PEP_ID=MMETSP1068-20121228/14790_1 /TAXON_ID=35684 /ORGANISM="Pseudopedinella elastica, Strain CCMP716" /LENGTH=497 /DNA_ID=CAMNT_0013393659 /DNA_START=133 /DNA_END=1626 /DNA_ORIENTATION=+